MTQRRHPAPDRRLSASAGELDDLARVIGVRLAPAAAAAVLDPRGPVFQRAEWLGDSILDALTADLRTRDAHCLDRTSDAALMGQAQRSGLVARLDWMPGEERLADLVEAVLGFAWLSAGWGAARTVAARLVDPAFSGEPLRSDHIVGLDELVDAADSEPAPADARAGAAVLEATAAVSLFRAYPDADEGRLSSLRRPLLDSRRLASAFRTACNERRVGDPTHAADHVQAAVGRLLSTHTLAAAVESARSIVST